MSKSQYKHPVLTLQQVRDLWENYKQLSIRDKLKKRATMTYQIDNVDNIDNLPSEKIEELIDMLKELRSNKSIPLMTLRYLRSKGLPEPRVVLERKKKIVTDIAMFMVSDASFAFHSADLSNKNLLNDLNQGIAFFFNTPGDGTYNITLILVDGEEPLLPIKTLKSMDSHGELVTITCPSGVMKLSGSLEVADLELNLSAGNYRLAVYTQESDDDFDYYITLAKTNNEAKNNLSKLPDIRS